MKALPTAAWHGVDFEGGVTVESYVVDVGTEGPVRAMFTGIAGDGARVFAHSEDPDLLEALLADEDACGREARVAGGLLTLRA